MRRTTENLTRRLFGRKAAPRLRTARPRLEFLEDRINPTWGPMGPEGLVNVYTSGDQMPGNWPSVSLAPADDMQAARAVAVADNGMHVVVWESNSNPGGSGWDIYARLFDAAGNPLGNEFRVNSSTSGEQICPSVAMDGSGNFIV